MAEEKRFRKNPFVSKPDIQHYFYFKNLGVSLSTAKSAARVATSTSTPRSSAFASSLRGIRYHRSRKNRHYRKLVEQSKIHPINFIFPKSSFPASFLKLLIQQPKKLQNYPLGDAFFKEKTTKLDCWKKILSLFP